MNVAWYTPEAWARLAALPEARIEKSYQDFVRTFETTVREFAAHGVLAEKVVIDAAAVSEMIEWCHRHGYEIDARGRAVYGAARSADALNMPLVDKTRSIQ
jgi:hypothetical protein